MQDLHKLGDAYTYRQILTFSCAGYMDNGSITHLDCQRQHDTALNERTSSGTLPPTFRTYKQSLQWCQCFSSASVRSSFILVRSVRGSSTSPADNMALAKSCNINTCGRQQSFMCTYCINSVNSSHHSVQLSVDTPDPGLITSTGLLVGWNMLQWPSYFSIILLKGRAMRQPSG
jgi:hypothetical protein